MSIMVATGKSGQTGVRLRNAEAVEGLREVDKLVIDKTGRLTEGRPRLTSVVTSVITPEMDEQTLLRLAASLERGSEHPLAAAIVAGAEERGLELNEAKTFESLTGKGVAGEVDGHKVSIGNQVLVAELGLTTSDLGEKAETLRLDGQTGKVLNIDGALSGLVFVARPV